MERRFSSFSGACNGAMPRRFIYSAFAISTWNSRRRVSQEFAAAGAETKLTVEIAGPTDTALGMPDFGRQGSAVVARVLHDLGASR